MADERYALEETTVRFGRSKLWLALSLVPSLAMLAVGLRIGVLFFVLPLPIILGFLAKGTHRTSVVASREGLRIGTQLVPRASLSSALVRHERHTTYVELTGKRDVDVEVANNIEADALVRALGLDAASTTVEVPVNFAPSPLAWLVVIAGSIGLFFAWAWLALLTFVVGAAIVLVLAPRATLRIGADGIAIRKLIDRSRFVAHGNIVAVDVQGDALIVRETGGRETRLIVRDQGAGEDQARAIARRIMQARRARRSMPDAPELAVALDRGAQTTREWLTDLRKLGEGTIATFRTIGVAREQLLDVVESTTASAKDRMAALVALRPHLREEEKTRIRVATESIAAPAVRDHMVRVLDSEDEDEMIEALEAVDHN